MDIGNRFSLEDFLAYFFPGVTGSIGIYILLRMTRLNSYLPSLSADITTGIIFFISSYIVGIIFSGFSELAFLRVKGYKDAIPLQDGLKKVIIEAFRDTFKISKDITTDWSRDHFYLCRSLVFEHMPSILPLIQRQSSLRQLRINLLPTLVIWFFIGLCWGIQGLIKGLNVEGIVVMITSLVLFLMITIITINRAKSNEWREVREVLTAFGAGYQKGLFREKDKTE